MPTLSFTFGIIGIERGSAVSTQRHPWSDVKAVRRYTKGYLLLFADQDMPVPHRWLKVSLTPCGASLEETVCGNQVMVC